MRISGDGYFLHNVFKCWLLHSSWADTKQQNRKHNENNNFEFFILINKSLFNYVRSFLQNSIASFQLHLLTQRIFRMHSFTFSKFIKLFWKLTSMMKNLAPDFYFPSPKIQSKWCASWSFVCWSILKVQFFVN